MVFNPYFASLGGGEYYSLKVADVLAEKYELLVAGPVIPKPEDLRARGFSAGHSMVTLSSRSFARASRNFDVAVRTTNVIPSATRAPRSILIVQFPLLPFRWEHPFRPLQMKSLLDKYQCITYSEFVAGWCEQRWGVSAQVISPPVEMGIYAEDRKAKMILSVGRFSAAGHDKRQDVLIDAFSRLPHRIRQEWCLVLAGGASHPTSAALLNRLRKRAGDLNVRIEADAPRDRLVSLFDQATLYWHAAGFGRDPSQPELAEHFGIATVEAMSFGAVPLVFDDGGQREVVPDSQVGLRWTSIEQLVGYSAALIADSHRRSALASSAQASAARYSPEVFRAAISGLLE